MKRSQEQLDTKVKKAESQGPHDPPLVRRPISQAPIGSMPAGELKAIFDPIEMF